MKKTVEYYINLPYTRELTPEAEGGWFVRIKELPGCMTFGNTPDEALRMIDDAMRGWLEVELEDNSFIPEPREEEAFSGKFNTRVPKSLHRKLVEAADQDGVSLNQWINTALSEAVGEKIGRALRSIETQKPMVTSQNIETVEFKKSVSQSRSYIPTENYISNQPERNVMYASEQEGEMWDIKLTEKKKNLLAKSSPIWNKQPLWLAIN